MKALVPSDVFRFENLRLDRRGLLRQEQGDVFVPVKIGSRAFDILRMLIERPGELVLREELVAAVWPGRVVEDSNLTVQISALRRALDRGQTEGNCIQAVAGRGYRFIASVTRCDHRHGSGRPGRYQPRALSRAAAVVHCIDRAAAAHRDDLRSCRRDGALLAARPRGSARDYRRLSPRWSISGSRGCMRRMPNGRFGPGWP